LREIGTVKTTEGVDIMPDFPGKEEERSTKGSPKEIGGNPKPKEKMGRSHCRNQTRKKKCLGGKKVERGKSRGVDDQNSGR